MNPDREQGEIRMKDRRRRSDRGGRSGSLSRLVLVIGLLAMRFPASASAGEADVVEASARCSSDSLCHFRVTVRHADEGWSHHANRWEVLSPDGEILATRTLHHPHVEEQPFTRRLRDVRVPPGVETVRIRAHDSLHGYGGAERTIPLDRPPHPPAP